MSMVPPVRSTLPSLPAASSASSALIMREHVRRSYLRRRAAFLLLAPHQLRDKSDQGDRRNADDLGELHQERRDQREQPELLRRDPADQRGQAELRDVVGGGVELRIALAVVVF